MLCYQDPLGMKSIVIEVLWKHVLQKVDFTKQPLDITNARYIQKKILENIRKKAVINTGSSTFNNFEWLQITFA